MTMTHHSFPLLSQSDDISQEFQEKMSTSQDDINANGQARMWYETSEDDEDGEEENHGDASLQNSTGSYDSRHICYL